MKIIELKSKTEDEKIRKTARKVNVYEYQNVNLAYNRKRLYLIIGFMMLLLASASFFLDVFFAMGKNIWVYGYGIFSGLLIFVSLFAIIDRYRYRQCVLNLPRDKYFRIARLGINLTELILFIVGLIISIGRISVYFLTNDYSTTFIPNNFYADIAQLIIFSSYLILIVSVFIHMVIFNKKNLRSANIYAEFNEYRESDIIKDFRPYTWIIILVFAALVFFVAPLL